MERRPRVLYSFPHRIGAQRICLTAWQQVTGAAAAGADITVLCASVERSLPPTVEVVTTLSRGRLRLPFRVLGRYKSLQVHDWATARWLDSNASSIDVVHCWPGASLRTIAVAKRHGIPCMIERPNTHTEYAYQAAAEESRRCGIELPAEHDHAFDRRSLEHEVREYAACDFLLCPSEFVERTFVERGTPRAKILRHRYGFDEGRFAPVPRDGGGDKPLTAVYAGVCEPRKGLHYALEAWQASDLRDRGRFLICGGFVPGYREALGSLLEHPGITYLGHRNDLPEIMRSADVFVLSSVEEGSALVTYEARGSGCVLLVSDASGAVCTHGHDALVHPMRDVGALTNDLNRIASEPGLLEQLRANSVAGLSGLTWSAAGEQLCQLYDQCAVKRHTPLSV